MITSNEIEHLRQEIGRLTTANSAQAAELARLSQLNQKLVYYIRGLVRGRYGRSTEKLLGDHPIDQQLIAEVEAFQNDELAKSAASPAAAAALTPVAPAPVEAPAPPVAPADKPHGRRTGVLIWAEGN